MSAHVDFSKLTLVAASPAQEEAAACNTSYEWAVYYGGGYLDEVYLAHIKKSTSGAAADGLAFARDGKWAAWVLVPRDDPTTTDILASCATYQRESLRLVPGGTPETTVSYGVAAVFTHPYKRKRGYARHMLRLLHYVLAPTHTLPPFPAEWGAAPTDVRGDAAFSVLNSGIGDRFYTNCTKGTNTPGWVHNPVAARKWIVADDKSSSVADIEGAEWVPASDLAALARVEADMDERMRRALSTTGDATKTRFLILPTGQLQFQSVFSGDQTRPSAANAVYLSAPEGQTRPFITYVCSEKKGDPRRMVLNHVSRGGDGAPVPFSAVMAAARREGAYSVEDWGDSGWDAHGAKLMPDELCPCIAVYGVEDDKALWVFCENYTWC